MMNSRAVHFWVNETGEQFARWLERETRHWSGASLPLELSLDPYICAFEPFKAAPDLLSVSTRWTRAARTPRRSQQTHVGPSPSGLIRTAGMASGCM